MIACADIGVSAGGRNILSGVTLALADGQRVVLMGPSGAGKTTLLRVLAGLLAPEEGTVTVSGRQASVAGRVLVPPSQRSIGFVFQSAALWPHMTVAQNVLYGLADLPRREAQERMRQALAACRVEALAERLPQQLSGGEQRRVALARAIAPRPRHLFMDEPLTSLDSDLKGELLNLVTGVIAADATAVLYVTHEEDEARAVGGTRLYLAGGRLGSQT